MLKEKPKTVIDEKVFKDLGRLINENENTIDFYKKLIMSVHPATRMQMISFLIGFYGFVSPEMYKAIQQLYVERKDIKE